MKNINKYLFIFSFILSATCLMSCEEANEFEGTNTDNPTFAKDWENAPHPESLAGTTWVRGTNMKTNVYGEEVQGYVESMNFYREDSVIVKMSEGTTKGTWVDDSNTKANPHYEYVYTETTGKIEVKKEEKDDKGKVSKTIIFTAVAVTGKKDVMTVAHYGDTPVQTYLVKQ